MSDRYEEQSESSQNNREPQQDEYQKSPRQAGQYEPARHRPEHQQPPHQRQHRSDEPDLIARIPWKSALAFGLISFLLGYGILYGVYLVDASTTTDGEFEFGEHIDSIQEEPRLSGSYFGYLYFGAQFVETNMESDEVSFQDGSVQPEEQESNNMLEFIIDGSDAPPNYPMVVYQTIPVIVLLAGGYGLARRRLSSGDSKLSPISLGASITVGYLVAVGLSTVVFRVSTDGVNMSVESGTAILIAGLAYPLLFGAIGGYFAGR